MILLTVSVLFFLVSSRSYDIQSSHLESMELFRLFRGISNLMALFIPLAMFVFYLLTSNLMFTLLNEKFESGKMARIISLSFLPVILNCLVYLIILYDIDPMVSLQKMTMHRSILGLGLADMEQVSYLFWAGFYLFLAVLTKYEFGMCFGKAAAISFIPTLLVVMGKVLL